MNKLREFVRTKRQSGDDIKIPRIKPDSNEFTNVQDITTLLNAEILEYGGELRTTPVAVECEQSGFSYFLDGIERKKILFYYRSIPCIYGYVAAAIMGRTDRKMHSTGIEDSTQFLYLDATHFPNDLGIKIKDISKDEPMLPDQYIFEAHKEIQKVRGEMERSLAKQWLRKGNKDGWLFVDGRLEKMSKDLTFGANMVGIVKSHHASYFDYENQYRIYSMKKGERSSVFQPEGENVYSWYLRLHYDSKYGTNDFGLIRVEVPAEEEFLEKADLISSWILLETRPVAFPASRWDRMIYPIKYCEDYLKSKAPSYTGLSL